MSAGILAAITLHPRGGGVAGVARLLWQVLRDQATGSSRLVTLLEDERAASSVDSTRAMRVRFGARLAKEQLVGDAAFVLYSHLSLAQVQAFIPAAVRRPYAIFLHGIEAWRSLSPAQRGAIEGAKLLIANSQYTADRIAEVHPWVGPIAACPLALPPVASDARSKPAAPSRMDTVVDALGPHVVLVVARMSSKERYKGHDQLLEAWSAVRARVPDAQLVFAGGGDDIRRLQAKAATHGVASSVVFPGFVSDETLHRLYRQAAVFAMPSRDEGFGLVYLEAMSHGLPCVGSTHDAARETIQDGVTGILAAQDDVPNLAGSLVRLLSDEALRREMGRRGFERLQHRFGYPVFRDRLTRLLASNNWARGGVAMSANSN